VLADAREVPSLALDALPLARFLLLLPNLPRTKSRLG
jgi:hypothetical protein